MQIKFFIKPAEYMKVAIKERIPSFLYKKNFNKYYTPGRKSSHSSGDNRGQIFMLLYLHIINPFILCGKIFLYGRNIFKKRRGESRHPVLPSISFAILKSSFVKSRIRSSRQNKSDIAIIDINVLFMYKYL